MTSFVPFSKMVLPVLSAFFLANSIALSQADIEHSILITADQQKVEPLALKIFNSVEVQQELEETRSRLLLDPASNTPDGIKTLNNGAEEMAFWASLTAANGDPANPKMIWGIIGPHAWLGQKTPGSRIGIENPDNVYRTVTLNSAYRYEITVRPNLPEPFLFSFFLFSSYMGEDSKQSVLVDTPLGGLLDNQIQREIDGSFKITLDSSASNGRSNHLQLPTDVRELLIRETLQHWGTQKPMSMEINRIDDADTTKLNEKVLIQQAVRVLKGGSKRLLLLKNQGYHFDNGAPNIITKPVGRGGSWGFFAFGNFKLAKDEALLVTLDPAGAKYLGYVVTSPWMVSREHRAANGSLNNLQAQPNSDGTYTYVISPRDPGVQNWLDTEGLHDGAMMIRWQAMPDSVRSIDDAVREQKVVKLVDLNKLLPAETNKVTVEQRQQLYTQRAKDYAHRYLSH